MFARRPLLCSNSAHHNAQRPSARTPGRHLPQTHRPGRVHDRIESYQKTQRRTALLVHSPTAKDDAMNDTGRVIAFPSRAASQTGGRWTPERRAAGSAAARRPRRSKNGTPEERAAKAAAETSGAPTPAIETSRSETANIARHEALRRATEMIGVLRESSKQHNYVFDEQRAARLLENLCTFDADDGDDPKFHQIIEWVSDHKQSLDWIFCGDPRVMICAMVVRP
jgi:hypothetical protein